MTIKLNEETLAKFFAKAFHEIVVPVIEDLHGQRIEKLEAENFPH